MTSALRVATWNVESIRAHTEQVVNWLAANDVDVLCMQETRASLRTFPTRPFEEAGYRLVIGGGEGGQAGVAIATRLDITDVEIGIPGAVAPLNEVRSISATVEGIRLHTCYAPNGRKVGTEHHEQKLAWFALFTAWTEIDRHPLSPSLVVGDLNIAPTDLDVWEPSRYRRRNLTSPRERVAFESLLDQAGLIDSARERFGNTRVYTWWNRRSDFYATDRGWRLDHVLGSPEVDARIAHIVVDRAERARVGSADHAPIIIDLVSGS